MKLTTTFLLNILAILVFGIGCTNTGLKNATVIEDRTPKKTAPKKLISASWHSLTPAKLKENLSQMEARPFQGVMWKLSFRGSNSVFHKTSFPDSVFKNDIEIFNSIQFAKLTDNFLKIDCALDTAWDWFNNEDWAATEKNIRNFARAAKQTSSKGIIFDPESYGRLSWKYPDQLLKDKKSFTEYQEIIRQRGRRYITIMEDEFPGFQLMFMFFLSANYDDRHDQEWNLKNLLKDQYGLYPDFIDGILSAKTSNSKLIEGNESSYYYGNKANFTKYSTALRKEPLYFLQAANQPIYEKQVKIAHAVYPDLLLDLFKPTDKGWYGVRVPHFLSPANRQRLLEHNTYYALQNADEYVWFWEEYIDWTTPGAQRNKNDTSILSAYDKIMDGEPLGFDLTNELEEARKKCNCTKDAYNQNFFFFE